MQYKVFIKVFKNDREKLHREINSHTFGEKKKGMVGNQIGEHKEREIGGGPFR